MGYTVNDLIIACKVLFQEKACLLDSNLPISPWRDLDFKCVFQKPNNIKIGVIEESYFLKCSDSVKRAMKISENALK